jgi:hypothetical protein
LACSLLTGWILAAALTINQLLIADLTTLWAWDSDWSKWYFYAPSLARAGLDFSQHNKTLGKNIGFWVNKP